MGLPLRDLDQATITFSDMVGEGRELSCDIFIARDRAGRDALQ